MTKAAGGDAGRPSCSASTIAASTVSGYHLLKIDGYSLTKDVATGTCIMSRSFTIGGHAWSIRYYPNGVQSDSADYISLYLTLGNAADQAVKARSKFSLLHQSGEPAALTVAETVVVRSFSKQNSSWGYPEFIKREDLEKPGHYLKDDSFTIRCDVTIFNEIRTEDTKVKVSDPFVVVPPSDLTQHLGGLLSAGEAADVTFSVAGETIAAHRYMLAARSPVFKAELLGSMKESTTTDAIPIADMEANVFRAMLCFIYTDSLQEGTTMEDDDAVFFQHLLAAADIYDLPRLKLTCENKLCKHIDIETAATMLALAEQHHCHGLKKACLEFLRCPANLKAVMATDGFEHLTRSCVSIVRELIAKLVD